MAARRRQRKRDGWPLYLYETQGYYYWRHPVTKEAFGLGRDLDKAKAEAIEANLHIDRKKEQARLVDRITGNDVRTVSAVLVRYVQDMQKRNLAQNTIKAKSTMINAVEAKWGILPYSALTTAMIDEFLQSYVAQGKERMAKAYQSFLAEIGNKAIAIGYATHNPAAVTEQLKATVKRSRLTLEQFVAIYDAAAKVDPYVQRAMEIALVTAQRREDVALFERSDVHDGCLWVEQGKSENIEARGAGQQTRLAIPTDLRLVVKSGDRVIDWTLQDIITRCRSDRVVSKYLIHHSKTRTKSSPGDAVWKDTISRAFSRARDLSGIEFQGATPPTFHEIRSLSIRLWKELRGKDFAQALAGHKQASTTDIYTNERGNWVMLKSA